MNPLDNIRVVLVKPSHPGNIGGVARAMKNMGLSQLYLVAPSDYPSARATERAAGADDILAAAQVVESLDEVLADCRLVVGTSSRTRELSMPALNPRECAETVLPFASDSNVALLFGCERFGLTNEEFLYCHYHTYIPTHSDYCSLNLAAAVQVLCYELRMAVTAIDPLFLKPVDKPALVADLDRFYTHLGQVLQTIGVIKPRAPKKILERLRRMFNRIQLEDTEVRLLRGILSAVENHSVDNNEASNLS